MSAVPQLEVAPSGERLRKERQTWCNLQVKLCDPCLSALRVWLTNFSRWSSRIGFQMRYSIWVVAGYSFWVAWPTQTQMRYSTLTLILTLARNYSNWVSILHDCHSSFPFPLYWWSTAKRTSVKAVRQDSLAVYVERFMEAVSKLLYAQNVRITAVCAWRWCIGPRCFYDRRNSCELNQRREV